MICAACFDAMTPASLILLFIGVDSSLTQRLAEVESKLREGFDDKVAAATQGLSTGGWKLPFFLLFAMMVACAAGLYKWYQQLKKTHML